MRRDAWLARVDDGDSSNGQRHNIGPAQIPEGSGELLALFRMTGLMHISADGLAPLGWQDLQAFTAVTGQPLSHDQAESIITLSRAYVSVLRDKGGACPVQIDQLEEQRHEQAVQSWLQAAGVVQPQQSEPPEPTA